MPNQPKLPRSLEPAVLPGDALEDEARFYRLDFADLALHGQAVEVEFEECRFAGTSLAQAELTHASFLDCAVTSGDWANLRARDSRMVRVEVARSRLTGSHWINGVLREVAFRDCRMDLSAFRFTSCKNVEFADCDLSHVDFASADLRGARFVDCDLTGAQLTNADADGTRFTRCDLTGLTGVQSLKGAVISTTDLAALTHTLAAALGIVLDDV